MDILDKLKNAIAYFKGMSDHELLCQEAYDEIKLLRKQAIPDGYMPVPIVPTDEMIECLMYEWDTVGATSMYDNYKAMIEAALKPQKAST